MHLDFTNLTKDERELLDNSRACCINIHIKSPSGQDIDIPIMIEEHFSGLNCLNYLLKGLNLLDLQREICENGLYITSGTHPSDFDLK